MCAAVGPGVRARLSDHQLWCRSFGARARSKDVVKSARTKGKPTLSLRLATPGGRNAPDKSWKPPQGQGVLLHSRRRLVGPQMYRAPVAHHLEAFRSGQATGSSLALAASEHLCHRSASATAQAHATVIRVATSRPRPVLRFHRSCRVGLAVSGVGGRIFGGV